MSLVQEGDQIVRSRPRRPELSSLHRELLMARIEWLFQASTGAFRSICTSSLRTS